MAQPTKTIEIIVNGTQHTWTKNDEISYAEVVTLDVPDYAQHPEITYSVKYKNGHGNKPEGTLSPGGSVKVKDGILLSMFATPKEVAEGLREAGYATDPVLVQIIWLSIRMQKPILVEGPPGTGKTYLAQAFAAAAKTDLIRLQCFEGITEKQAIGSFDEALQRLFLETQAETIERHWEKLRLQLHTLDFFTQGPLLQAVLEPKPAVLLIDELDKVDQKFEALLLEILSDWQITIPKLGTVKAKTIPFVVMTSNQERRLGDPLRRRSLYQRIEHPDVKKEAEILDIRTVEAPLELKAQAVGLAQALRGYNLVKPPSIDEIVQFVQALQLLGRSEIRPEDRDVLLPFLAKTEEDVKRLLLRDGFSSLVATAHEYRDQALAAMRGGTELAGAAL
jgi:MoxR-like ATPase